MVLRWYYSGLRKSKGLLKTGSNDDLISAASTTPTTTSTISAGRKKQRNKYEL